MANKKPVVKRYVIVDTEWDHEPMTLEEVKESLSKNWNDYGDISNYRLAEIKYKIIAPKDIVLKEV